MSDFVVGIDLGTTNSAVAIARGSRVELLPVNGDPLLPSVVGFGEDDALLIGHPARNQRVAHPERTVASIKRRMGEEIELTIGSEQLTPVEISALILRRLKLAAEEHLQAPVNRAVITVPAYFDDAQRTATREAGEVAGFEVERILNEPTAAALCYLEQGAETRTFLVYDLGGGTFDVSVVRATANITEVLASHGDTRLGGDDFDARLYEHLRAGFRKAHGVDPDGDIRSRVRLHHAAEQAKIRLSERERVQVIEEHLMARDGVGLHLDMEVTRADYEALIEPLVHRTRDSVQIALREADVLIQDLDDILLVGGSTRTPLVRRVLKELVGVAPRSDVDPDKAVAMGAAIQAARVAGDRSQRILVDVSPFSFGTSHLGLLHGMPSQHCYRAIITRNTALPATRSETFFTVQAGQACVEVEVFQGEEPDARQNTLLGRFMVEDLDRDAPENSPMRFDLNLDLDGILQVKVTEVHTGHNKKVTIKDAFRRLSKEELIDARSRVLDLFGEAGQDWDFRSSERDAPAEAPGDDGLSALAPPLDLTATERLSWVKAHELLARVSNMLDNADLTDVDAEELNELSEQLTQAMHDGDIDRLQEHVDVLSDVLFYLE